MLAKLVGLLAERVSEQGADRDAADGPFDLGVEVDVLAGLPAIHHTFGFFDDDRGVAVDATETERGLHEPAAAGVVVAVADDEGGLAVDGDEGCERLPPGQVAGVGRQDRFVRGGAEYELIADRPSTDRDDRSPPLL